MIWRWMIAKCVWDEKDKLGQYRRYQSWDSLGEYRPSYVASQLVVHYRYIKCSQPLNHCVLCNVEGRFTEIKDGFTETSKPRLPFVSMHTNSVVIDVQLLVKQWTKYFIIFLITLIYIVTQFTINFKLNSVIV